MADEQTLLTAAATPTAEVAAAETSTNSTVSASIESATQEQSDWRPEPLRGEKSLEKYKTQEDALKALVDAQKLIGKKADGIVPPGEDATPEQLEAFNAKLRELRGVPAEATAYEVSPPADAPEGYALNADLVGAFQSLALEAGLAPSEFKKMADGYMQLEVQAIAAARVEAKARTEKEEAALVKEWQAAGEVPKEKFSHALKAAQALGLVSKSGTESILGHLGNNTALIKALSDNVYPLIAEGRLKGGGHEQTGPVYTPQEAIAKGRAMMADPRYKDSRQRDPDYVREVDAFFEQHGKLIARR
jgi:hypothetical protein